MAGNSNHFVQAVALFYLQAVINIGIFKDDFISCGQDLPSGLTTYMPPIKTLWLLQYTTSSPVVSLGVPKALCRRRSGKA